MAMAAAGANFDIGRVIQRTFGLIGRNFVPFFVLTLVLAGLPSLVLQMAMPTDPTAIQTAPGSYFTTVIIGLLVSIATGVILQGALTRASIDDLSGKGANLGTAVSSTIPIALPLFGLGILAGLGIAAGALLLLIPGIFLALCWVVSSPVMVAERLGIVASMQRSMALTQGHRWAILGLIVLFMIAYFVLIIAVGAIIGGSMATFADPAGPPLMLTLILTLVGTLMSMVVTVGAAAVYFELRQIKEGVGMTELARVFE